MLCLRCQHPVTRIDSGTTSEIFSPGLYYAAGERIVWCEICRLYLVQNVEARIRDGGEITRRYVKVKIKARGEGT